ncbi:MAG TPA: FAD-dependent oxidoreductase [Solirubrobacterales bacterium]|nr:FAD-dependent oxidoreductase [Solirubrobacterales bacterium]
MARTHTAHGFWLEEAGSPAPRPPLSGDADADVVVVGGGFTGLWAAWWVLESDPGARVVVLEAAGCGEGPSGRNGGFVNAMSFSLPSMEERFGSTGALAVARAARDAVHGIGQWCERHGVDAWYREGGYLQVSSTPIHDDDWDEVIAAWRRQGEPDACVPLDRDAVRARCDSPRFRGGAFYPDAATVQPARLALGLRARLLDRGAAIHEHSRVIRLAASPDGVRAETGGGRVRARSAVLAVGAAASGVRPLRRRLTVTSSHIVITEPVPEVLEDVGWTGGESITNSRALIHYFRTTPDGRIAFGWGGGRVVPGARIRRRAELDPQVVAEVERALVRFFPGLAGRRIDHAWGGPIDVSPIHLPVVGTVPGDRVHYALGYTGNGLGPSHMVGRILASLALDRRDEWTRLPLVEPRLTRVPPEPFRYVGGAIVRRALLRKERLEEQGRRADLLTRAVAGFPERIGIHIGR